MTGCIITALIIVLIAMCAWAWLRGAARGDW